MINVGSMVIAIATIIITIFLYKKKMIALQEKEHMLKQRIAKTDEELKRRTIELENRILQFEKVQKLCEDLSKKTDREVLVEMHVKTMRIFEALNHIDQKLIEVKDYTEQFANMDESVKNAIDIMEDSLKESLEDMYSTISDDISDNISDNITILDERDVRSAVSDALDYDCYSFKNFLEETIRNVIRSEIN